MSLVRRSMLLVTLAAGTVMAAPAGAAPVGHRVERIQVPGLASGELRQVDVHLWYPAAPSTAPKTVYTSALAGAPLPNGWAPLSWSVGAELAQEGAPFDATGGPYTPIVFSHGATNDAIDYAHTLEELAAAGFVVVAPGHANNTQDDVRRDYINALAGQRVFDCLDGIKPARAVPTFGPNGFPSADCAKASVPNSMSDRVHDVSAVLDHLPGWFGNAVDPAQAGVMGHSRGTISALAVAGGTVPWGTAGATCLPAEPADKLCWTGVSRDPRVKAIMGMAIGAMAINNGVNLSAITVPTLLISGDKDRNTPTANTIAAFDQIPPTTDKTRVEIANATHRSFDSTYCAQLRSAALGAAATDSPLDRWNLPLIAASWPAYLSGKAVHYCSAGTFTGIEPLIAATTNAEFGCTDAGCGWVPHTVATPANQLGVCTAARTTPPCTGLDTDAVKADIVQRATAFFGSRLDRKPPRLTVPTAVTVDATGPSGATVPFTATAVDEWDATPTVTCDPVAGTAFAIGTTTVTCTATDDRGNTSTQSFTVTVKGAGAQLADLLEDVVGARNVPAAARALLTALDPSRPLQRAAACATLRAFTTIVRVLAPSRTAWIADANRIRAVLAC